MYPHMYLWRNEMLYLDQKLNRVALMTTTTVATIALLIATIPGLNAVGILFAVGLINIFVYYTLPDGYSTAYAKKYLKR
jgi:predicted exporter